MRQILRVEVEDDDAPLGQTVDHCTAGIGAPGLNHPFALSAGPAHGLPDGTSGSPKVHALHAAAFMERIHAEKLHWAVKLLQLVVVGGRNVGKAAVGGLEKGRSVETVPQSGILDIDAQLGPGIVGEHP